MDKGKNINLIYADDYLKKNGALIIPNCINYNHIQKFEKAFPKRKIIYIVEEKGTLEKDVEAHLHEKNTEALLFSMHAAQAPAIQNALSNFIKSGALVLLIPPKVVCWPGSYLHVAPELISFLLQMQVPIVPLFISGDIDFQLSIEEKVEDIIYFSFGKMIEWKYNCNFTQFQENLLLAAHTGFSKNAYLDINLTYALLKGLKKHGKNAGVFDAASNNFLSYEKLLAATISLSSLIKKCTHKERVGIVLPPTNGGFIANLAVLFANKVPVNLNFTASSNAIKSSIKQAEIDLLMSAETFKKKVEKFPWFEDEKMLMIDKALKGLKFSIIKTIFLNKFRTAHGIAAKLNIPRVGGNSEAVLLFTSGSSGAPKGVPLSHRNIIANVKQITTRLGLQSEEKILGSLPLFHSFGTTVTLWYPIIEGLNVVTYPSPLNVEKLSQLVEEHNIALLIATPTFLRGYLRKATKKQLSALKFVVTGAEKLPQKLAKSFKEKFGKEVMEGYGLTETSPVTNVNLPNLSYTNDANLPILESYRPGSVGQLMPGIAVKITKVDDDKNSSLPLNKQGQVWLKGENIFNGYLNKEDQKEKTLENRWLATGDIGHLDKDGFLFIEGRISRFSKIAGEMVPHETIENAITNCIKINESNEKKLLILGKSDTQKGEILVALYAGKARLKLEDIRKKLIKEGIPNLWIPKKITNVEKIPILASGKIDFQKANKLI